MDCCAPLTSAQDLAQLFAFGLVMSAGHCLGMCGPLVGAVSLAHGPRRDDSWSFALSVGTYHLGRLTSYALLGVAVGSLGGAVLDHATTVLWQSMLSFLAAAALVWIGLGLLDVTPFASFSWAGRLTRSLATWLGGVGGPRSVARRFALGMANGFLPCGPVYTVAVAALAAGGAGRGALAMAAYGAGTLPLLVGVSLGFRFFGSRLAEGRVRAGFHRAAAVLALLMGLQLALRGLASMDWVPHARIDEVVLW